ncbi:MAG: EAL domain-containing protein [Rhodospirillaceae bacterium]
MMAVEALAKALERCTGEAIHLAGAIQPHGVLIGLDGLTVAMVSANFGAMFDFGPDQVIGRPVAEVLGPAAERQLLDAPARGELSPSIPTFLDIQSGARTMRVAAQVHRSDRLLIIELEHESFDRAKRPGTDFVPVSDALWSFEDGGDIAAYSTFIAEQLRLLTDFDRVLVYRFDPEWNGDVIAEARNDRLPSLVGHHFPASDIPPQARDLYTKNLIRLLADAYASPVPLLPPKNPLTGAPLDLSFSVLRAISPVHIEYLRNMGVRASATVSLMVNGRLWGLIACHNQGPREVSFQLRELVEIVGRTASLKLSNMETAQRNAYMTRIRWILVGLTRMLRELGDVGQLIRLMETEILDLVGASGLAIGIGSQRYFAGRTPDDGQVERLAVWVKTMVSTDQEFHCDTLAELYPPAAAFVDSGAGLLAVCLDEPFGDYILWFRGELVRTISWAGNPEKSLIVDSSGPRIEPRRSFSLWEQNVRGHSLPWSDQECDAARSLSRNLVEILALRALRQSEHSYRLLAENSTDMISRHDADGAIVFTSPACREILERSPDSLIGETLTELALAEDRPALQAAQHKVMATGLSDTVLFRYRRADGSSHWIESTIKRSEEDRQMVVNSRDVTERQEYQLAIEEMQQRNAAILESAGEGILGLDSTGHIRFANPVAAQLLGYEAGELAGLGVLEAVRCEPVEGHVCDCDTCPILAVIRTGEALPSREVLFRRRDGALFPVELIATPIHAGHGHVDGVVIVFRNISERRAAEDRLRQSDTVYANAAEAIMVMDASGLITGVNRAFTEMTGFTEEEVIGQPPSLLKSGYHPASFYEGMWREVMERRSWRGEIWNRRKSGEAFPMWGSITVVSDHRGNIRNFVTVFTDISKAKEVEGHLQYLATYDPLTNLPNRMLFTDRLQHALFEASRNQEKLAIVFVDFDHFKIINDTLGHAAGDEFLVSMSRRLTETLRPGDTLARWGGDEFIMVMERVQDVRHVAALAGRLLTALSAPILLAGKDFIPSASAGIALYPDNGTDPSRLVQAADAAMYRAKHLGRNRIEFFTKELTEKVEQRFRMSSEIRRALIHNEFRLVYQPQCQADSGAATGLEALIRWQHPEQGLISPAQFLPIADELGLMEDIGDWVLRAVCRQIRDWGPALPDELRVAVNVAPCQLNDGFVAKVSAALAEYGVPAERIEVEITEDDLDVSGKTLGILEALRRLGVRLALDDFGSGYSSLGRLRDMPIDKFKIDKSFVDGLPQSNRDLAIVRAIMALGSSLNVSIIAEGVELQSQVLQLRGVGVTVIQGYVFSRPLAVADVLPFIARH